MKIPLKYSRLFVILSYRKNFPGSQNEFESVMVNEPTVLELLKFYCLALACKIPPSAGTRILWRLSLQKEYW